MQYYLNIKKIMENCYPPAELAIYHEETIREQVSKMQACIEVNTKSIELSDSNNIGQRYSAKFNVWFDCDELVSEI